jgi:hypothetical protein
MKNKNNLIVVAISIGLVVCLCTAVVAAAALILATSKTPLLAKKEIKPGDVIAAFQAAGLEAEGSYLMSPEDYGLAPLADEGIRFLIPSLGPDNGGRVLYFKDPAYLAKSEEFYTRMGKEMAALHSWVFVRDNILVQINGELPEEQARKYEAVLQNMQP